MRYTFRAAVLLCAVMSAAAQSQLATVSGTVTDPSGAAVPGAKIHLVNSETGESRQAESEAGGTYFIPLVKPGMYTLSAEASGFKQLSRGSIQLETGAAVGIDFRLEIGAATESVSVTASAPLLKSESSAVGAVVENRTIVNMPLIDRRAAQLAKLSGFVVQGAGSATDFSMAGGRSDNAMWIIDGGSAQNVTLGNPQLEFDPPVESLQEFNVSISNYAAELGRTGGGVVQMTTKSGTNQFHGSAYEYLRNDDFDARSFFSAAKPVLRYNLFGTSLGGPVRKDKTHFFFNYEGRRQTSQSAALVNLPTPAETRGDFSASSTVIRDPAAAGRPPFPGNIIPSTRLDPVGAKLAAFYPPPNVPGRPSGSSNFSANQTSINPNNTYVARVDHVFREKDRVYGRALINTGNGNKLPYFPTPGVDDFTHASVGSYYNYSGTWFHQLTPTTINEFRFTYDRRTNKEWAGGKDQGIAQDVGLTGTSSEFPPTINITGYTGLVGSGNHERYQTPIRNNEYIDNVTLIRGSHAIKSGILFRYASNLDLNRSGAGGRFTFNNVATGNGMASLLLGWVTSASLTDTYPTQSRADTAGAFVQDDWKVTPRFTLNLGLRYDLDQPRWESIDNRQNSFDPHAINPVSGTPGVVTFSGRNGLSKYAHNWDLNNFGPRLGFAWRVGERWVVRGGAAILYEAEYDSATPLVAGLGFSIQGNFTSPDNGLTPAFLLRDGMPAIKPPTNADLTPGFGAVPVGASPTTSVEAFDPYNRRNGYLETFNFNIQRELTKQILLEADYVGTLGHKLAGSNNLSINQVPTNLLGPGNAQIRRPFPQFTDVGIIAPAIGNSNYHGLNLHLEKRFSAGLHFQANYTFSRFIDDMESRVPVNNAGNSFVNNYDRRQNRGLSGNDIKHRLVWSSVYELPIGKGKPLDLGFWDHIIGGWSSGLIAEIRSGSPFGVTEQTNTTGSFSPNERPNVVGNPVLGSDRPLAQKLDQWFNTAAFAQPAQYTFGNAGRTAAYGPGSVNVDLSVLKDFPVREIHRLQFRIEMLNFFNHPNFGLPNTARGAPNFGRITSLSSGTQSRVVQLGVHYKF